MRKHLWGIAVLVLAGACGEQPLLASASPDVARSGEEILLAGSGFGERPGRVTFAAQEAPVVSWSPTRVRVRVPPATQPDVTVKLERPEGAAATLPFTVYDAMTTGDGTAGRARTFVTLTFDDTTADQLQARGALEAHGMRATFYVNSSRIGSASSDLPRYMTLDEVKALQAAGHELGGHTKHHLPLALLEPDEVVRQVCGDRQQLLLLGLDVQHFAYPFESHTEDVARIVESCGYRSARTVDRGAVWPLVVPAPDPFAIPVSISVTATTALERLERYVLEAERSEGSWAVLVFHRVCDGCSSAAVRPADFNAFVDWLAQRHGRGTVVRTMRQMMGAGSPMERTIPPPRLRPGPNLVMNGSLEAATRGTINPDCFLLGDTGHELANWARVSPGHEGDFAVRLLAGEPLTSNRRVKMLQDDGACAPPVEAGAQYEFSVWYQSDVPLRFNAFLEDDQSFWAPWALSPSIPASQGTWSKATWRLPLIPEAVKALTVSVRLQQGMDGSMTLDEFSLVRAP